jgi:hypothetical protein
MLNDRPRPAILPVRAQSDWITELVRERLDTVLPRAMKAAGIDMWIVLCQEDDTDPLYKTMIPFDNWLPNMSCLVFAREGDGVRRYNLSAADTKDLYERPLPGRTGQMEAKQWAEIARLVEEHDPEAIGINIGETGWCTGGLSYLLHTRLCQALPARYRDRLVSAEPAGILWGSILTPSERVLFTRVIEIGRHLINECFTTRTITPGITTVEDLAWHYWQLSRDFGLEVSFRPRFVVHRNQHMDGPADVVMPGDVIHCDTGIKYMRLNSDHQHVAYVPRPGETDAPPGLKARLADNLKLQDIYMAGFRHGASGNQMLSEMLAKARAAGLVEPRIYSHNLGLFLHEPGPLIGLPWEQVNTGARGDVTLEYASAFVMELSTDGAVPEWGGQVLRLGTEEPVWFDENGCHTVISRQTEFHVI